MPSRRPRDFSWESDNTAPATTSWSTGDVRASGPASYSGTANSRPSRRRNQPPADRFQTNRQYVNPYDKYLEDTRTLIRGYEQIKEKGINYPNPYEKYRHLYPSQQQTTESPWTAESRGLGTSSGGGGGASITAPRIDTEAGSLMPALPPELQRWYEEQLSQARTEEDMLMAQARLAQRNALLEAAEMGRAARRQAAGRAVDVGAAMGGVGLGSSPALVGGALDQIYGVGNAGALSAEAARTAALENFLREQQGIASQGRRAKTDLEDWRSLALAALANEDIQRLIGMTPVGGM